VFQKDDSLIVKKVAKSVMTDITSAHPIKSYMAHLLIPQLM